MTIHIAIVDDMRNLAEERRNHIRRGDLWEEDVETRVFTSADELIDAVDRQGEFFEVVISDLFMPTKEEGGVKVKNWLARKKSTCARFGCVQLRWMSMNTDVDHRTVFEHCNAENKHWCDYLYFLNNNPNWDFWDRGFLPRVREALERVRQYRRATQGFVCESEAMSAVVALAQQYAQSDATVVITGETGTGKELIARMLHGFSSRSEEPFVPINCGTLGNTADSALFGHRKGSFTGADQARQGLFQSGHGGTVFLDETGELDLDVQKKLLRVLDDRVVVPVGADPGEGTTVDVRLVCATHCDLERMVAEGTFREDLWSRIKVALLRLPPLRERIADIRPLARSFVAYFASRSQSATVSLSNEVEEAFLSYEWPRNVRELRNTIEAAVACVGGSGQLRLDHLPPNWKERQFAGTTKEPARHVPEPTKEYAGRKSPTRQTPDNMTDLEHTIFDALVQASWNYSVAERQILEMRKGTLLKQVGRTQTLKKIWADEVRRVILKNHYNIAQSATDLGFKDRQGLHGYLKRHEEFSDLLSEFPH
jgi:DNA-binding NtrC family response regulator